MNSFPFELVPFSIYCPRLTPDQSARSDTQIPTSGVCLTSSVPIPCGAAASRTAIQLGGKAKFQIS